MLPKILLRITIAIALITWSTAPAQDGKVMFTALCSACHMPDRMHVGPSLVEIAGLYGDKRDDFLKWCKDPKPKRKGVIQMPSMASVSDDLLLKIHDYIMTSTKGVKEVVVKNRDKFRASPSMRKRPLVQRLFMPEAGPAAIAVAVSDDLHYCFDAGTCRLRYIWKGDFIDGWPVWRGNGDGIAKILGDVILRETKSPLPIPANAKRKFLGYRMKDGLPTFRYRIGKTYVEERITMAADTNGLARSFTLRDVPTDWRYTFQASEQTAYRSEDGKFDGTQFTPSTDKAKAFTVIMEDT